MQKLVFKIQNSDDLPLCQVKGGHDDRVITYLNNGPCCNRCSRKCARSDRRCCKKCLGADPEDDDVQGNISQTATGAMMDYTINGLGEMFVIPKENGAQHVFLFGPTGCGKSVFCGRYATVYKNVYPHNNVYLISYVDEDESLDHIRGLRRIPLKHILEGKITVNTISDSLVIFDDIDALCTNDELTKEEKKMVFDDVIALRDQLLTRGRHHGISVLVTSHLGCDSKNTKRPINESAAVVLYPKGGSFIHIDRMLKTYCGLNKKQEDKIKELPSRWVFVHKAYPPYVIHEKGVYLL